MFAWDLADLRLTLPILASILTLQGAGFVLGIGLLYRHIPQAAAAFVVTGIPVLNLITAGLIFEPQIVAGQRTAGSSASPRMIAVEASMFRAASRCCQASVNPASGNMPSPNQGRDEI